VHLLASEQYKICAVLHSQLPTRDVLNDFGKKTALTLYSHMRLTTLRLWTQQPLSTIQ